MSDFARLYAPLHRSPANPDSPVIYSYDHMRTEASWLYGYVKIKLDVNVAANLAAQSAYPDAVRTAILKQVAFAKEISLEQTRILLGWAAQKSLGYKVTGLRNNLGL